MDAFRSQKVDMSRVTAVKIMPSWKLLQFCFYRRNNPCVFSDSREVRLVIGYLTDPLLEGTLWDQSRLSIFQLAYSRRLN